MYKKVIFFFVVSVLFSFYRFAYASLIINEVMYDLSGSDSTSGKSREWIEVYNPDATDVAVDASKWRIYDGSANRTINGEVDFSIPSHAYIIFAGDKDTFLADNSGFSGIVYDTGITSLNNTGATLKIMDEDGDIVDSLSYTSSQGGAGDGNSLQKVSGSWTGRVPTPGVINQASSNTSTTTDPAATGTLANSYFNSSGSPNQTSASPAKNATSEEPKIRTQIISPNLVFSGIPVLFKATATGYNKEKLFFGKYFWNFGDGDSKEILANGLENAANIMHGYSYPGDYVATLEYYVNTYSQNPDALYKMTIKVIPADIFISNVGDDRDFFVELTNNTAYEADLSNWVLKSDEKNFILPKNTILNSKNKMTISSRLTHFSVLDAQTLKLTTSGRETVFDYGAATVPVVEESKPMVVHTGKDSSLAKEVTRQPAKDPVTEESPETSSANLTASVASSDVVKNSSESPLNAIIGFLFIGTCAGAVYFIRQRRTVAKAGDDFKILDE